MRSRMTPLTTLSTAPQAHTHGSNPLVSQEYWWCASALVAAAEEGWRMRLQLPAAAAEAAATRLGRSAGVAASTTRQRAMSARVAPVEGRVLLEPVEAVPTSETR